MTISGTLLTLQTRRFNQTLSSPFQEYLRLLITQMHFFGESFTEQLLLFTKN